METIFRFICRQFHRKVSGPLPGGEYECLECLRRWPITWTVQK